MAIDAQRQPVAIDAHTYRILLSSLYPSAQLLRPPTLLCVAPQMSKVYFITWSKVYFITRSGAIVKSVEAAIVVFVEARSKCPVYWWTARPPHPLYSYAHHTDTHTDTHCHTLIHTLTHLHTYPAARRLRAFLLF